MFYEFPLWINVFQVDQRLTVIKDKAWGLPLARGYFEASKGGYHPSLAAGIEKALKDAEGK